MNTDGHAAGVRHTVTVARARTHVTVWGTQGPVVLMLHGNPDTHAVWTALASRLSRDYQCVAPDLPGMGASEEPSGFDASLPAQSAWVSGLADAMDLHEPFHLVVHDVGGPYGLSFVCDEPERVRSLTVINTLFHTAYRWHPWARAWRTPGVGEAVMALMNRPLFERSVRRGGPGLSLAEIRAAYGAITPASKKAVLRWYRAMDPSVFAGWEDRLQALTTDRIPTRVIWGQRDPYIPAVFADRFGTRDVHRLADSGHWPMGEATEAVEAAVRAHLTAARTTPA